MRTKEEVEEVLALVASGLNDCEISRRTRIPRGTVRDWRHGQTPGQDRQGRARACPICDDNLELLDRRAYAYLLGQYLGDGMLSEHRRQVFRLRIVSDLRYPGIIKECAEAVRAVMPENSVGFVERHVPEYPDGGCVEIGSYSKHWPCLFPQHGRGRKHERPILLVDWQSQIVKEFPQQLIRGLIHSDGCRHENPVRAPRTKKLYVYSRYAFTNHSDDIRRLFCWACDELSIRWTRMNRWTISVARREDVARLDEFVGAKY